MAYTVDCRDVGRRQATCASRNGRGEPLPCNRESPCSDSSLMGIGQEIYRRWPLRPPETLQEHHKKGHAPVQYCATSARSCSFSLGQNTNPNSNPPPLALLDYHTHCAAAVSGVSGQPPSPKPVPHNLNGIPCRHPDCYEHSGRS
jgi:hypothetical protein